MEKSDEEDTYTASCERVLFAERSEVLEMLHKLAAKESNVEDASAKRGTLLEKVASCLEKYLEQPHLLDPHLDAMMDIVMARAKELVLEREAEVFGHLAASAGGGDGRLCPRPGETFPFQVFISPQLHAMFCVVYQLCRVRGAKTVARLMPHEAAELEPVIHALQAQDTDDYSTWETRYGLLLWLSMLSLVPFDIDSMDSGFAGTCGDERVSGGGGTHTGSGGGDGGQGRRDHQPQHQQQRPTDLVGTILSLGMRHLGDAGPTRDAAAACLGSILTRPDMEARHLQQFLEWGASVVERVARDAKGEREGFGKSTFLVMGVMATLAALFKQGHREKLVGLIPGVFYPVIDLAELGSGQTLLRKMIVKVLQRIGMTYLPPRVVSWRYQRGQRSLLQNLGTSTPDAKTHSSRAEEASLTGGRGDEEDGDFELEFDVPAELEGIVEALLCGLRDRDTVVRWSAAKGVGRITGRLPRELADDVVCSVLDLFVEAEGDGSWHGGCLALAELARRGLLVPERLPRACPLVQRALSYDVRRGGGGVGSHVRDAACYVCWAFARAYSPQVLGPHLPGLCDSLLAVALLDREVNVRRAAAAAFQENVGRQGQYGDGDQGNGVAHGIAIITAADYFSLGNRQQAFLEISQAVARFPRYRHQLLDWLRLNRLRHWDPEIRRLSALALHNLAVLEPGYIADTVLPATLKESLSPDLVRRHGACLAAAEVTLALGKVPHPIPSETLEDLVEVVPALEKARLYRGRGGELMRQAACRVVEALALIKAELSVKAQVRMLDSIDESLRHPVEAVQLSAVAALKAVLRNWFPVGAGGPSDRLQTRVTKKYIAGLRTEDNAAAARGYALALGVLPRKIAGASRSVVEDVLGALRDAAVGRHSPAESCRPSPPGAESEGADGSQDGKEKFEFGTGPGGELDAETRRNAIRGLIQVCEELGVGADGGSGDRGDGGDADGMLGNANAEVRPGNNGEGGATSSCGGRGTSQGRPAHVSDINRNGEGGEGDDGEGRGSTRVEDEDPSPGATGTHQIDAEDPEAASVTREKEGVENGAGRAFRRGGMGGTAPRSSTRSWHPQGLTLEDVEGVFGTLLAATGDYSVDNRGDVGSWCRIEALGALERLARLAVKASKGFPMKDRGEDADLSSAELLRRPETDYARLAAAGSPVSASTTFGEATIVGSRAGGEVLEVRYDPPSLGSFHFPYGTALLNKRDVSGSEVHRSGKAATFMVPRFEDRLALLDEPPGPVPKRGCHHCDRMFFSPIMMERLVCAVLKQLSEKLDSVRERAGTVLESIVHGQNPRLPFVPRREAIVDIMEGFDDDPAVEAGAGSGAGRRAAGSVNWASPAATFPMVVVLLAIPEYHDAIVSGLVVSVGGLSESVVKQSSSALLRWVKVCKSSGNKRALVTLGNCLVSTFGRAAGEARVVLPLLKTIEVLLSNDSFDFLYTEEHPLPESLRAAIVLELKGCRDVTKLCLGASVLVCMLDFGDPARSKALRNSVMLVAHRFPNVRKAAAEALYLKLLAAEELVSLDAQEEVLDILSSTPWDNDLDTAKAARSKLGKLLSVEVPQVTKPLAGEDASRASSASAGAKKDEMESYESLVRTAGY